MPAITKSGNVLTKKPTKIEESNSVSLEYVINETTLLNKLKTVDGEGSGLDADLLRGFSPSTTAQPNVIPVTGSDGKLASDFVDDSSSIINAIIFG